MNALPSYHAITAVAEESARSAACCTFLSYVLTATFLRDRPASRTPANIYPLLCGKVMAE